MAEPHEPKSNPNEKETKPRYEAPQVINLGELASGLGTAINCTDGSSAIGVCDSGSGGVPI